MTPIDLMAWVGAIAFCLVVIALVGYFAVGLVMILAKKPFGKKRTTKIQ